jgi:DNA-binding NarL/FixJ family response regulator
LQLVGGDPATRAEIATRLRASKRSTATVSPIVVALFTHAGGDGLGCVRAATQSGHRVLVLTDAPSPTEAGLAITAGAIGYLPLTATAEELRRALASIQAGTMYWTPPVAAAVLVGLRSRRLSPLVGDEFAAQLPVLLHLLRQGWPVFQSRRALNLDDQTTQQLLIAAQHGLW